MPARAARRAAGATPTASVDVVAPVGRNPPPGPGRRLVTGPRGGGRERRPVEHRLVAVVPEPVLAGLEALHDAVPGGRGVGGGGLGGRAVAAPDVAAGGAPPQVHPPALG